MTDCLKNISENISVVSKMSGGEGRYINKRFYDLIYQKPEETRTADEVIKQVLGGLMEKQEASPKGETSL